MTDKVKEELLKFVERCRMVVLLTRDGRAYQFFRQIAQAKHAPDRRNQELWGAIESTLKFK